MPHYITINEARLVDNTSFLKTMIKKRAAPSDSTFPTTTIDDIPKEILTIIFAYLHDAHTLKVISLISRSFNEVLKDNSLWKALCQKSSYGLLIKPQFSDNLGNVGGGVGRSRRSQSNTKQLLAKSANLLKQINLAPWRKVYIENYTTHRNWQVGKFNARPLSKEAGNLFMDFNDRFALSMSRNQPGKFWDLASGLPKIELQHDVGGPITSVKFDHQLIACGFGDGAVRVYNIKQRAWTFEFIGHHFSEIGCLDLHDSFVASGSEDQSIRIWNLHEGSLERAYHGHEGPITALQFNNTHLVSASTDSSVRIWSRETGECLQVLLAHEGSVFCVRFNSKFVVSGGLDSLIIIWDVQTGRKIRTLRGHQLAVVALQFDDNKIISGSADKTIKVWSFNGTHPHYSIKQHEAGLFGLHFNSSQILSSSFDNSLMVYDFSC